MYAELHCQTNFSFLEGASHPEELVERAAALGYTALAITDRASLAGVVRAHVVAKEVGLKLLVGAMLAPHDGPPLLLLATDRAAYGRLARLITLGRRNAPKGECRLAVEDVAAHAAGLLAGVLLCDFEEPATGPSGIELYREIFGDRCYLLAELHHGHDDARQLARWQQTSRRNGVPLVAAGGVLFHAPERRPLCDVLTATRLHGTIDEIRQSLLGNAERCLKPLDEIAILFSAVPEAVRRTVEIAARCQFSLDELRYEYPEELVPAGRTSLDYLSELTWRGARNRYPEGLTDKVCALLDYELTLIGQLRYEAYFLTVWDLVRFARQRGILCQGRGSAANSAVCYCLGVTAVDPARMDVLFERFISPERNEAPDIDVDFEHERREEVLQYVYEKYGRDRVGMTAEVITYRPRSAIRDVGKALGLSLDLVDALAKGLEVRGEPDYPQRLRQAGLDPDTTLSRQLIFLTRQLCGFPRHLSQHVGGMVMTRGLLCELVPIENAAMPGRTVIQWNKDDLDELGILKVDCLALGMLTAIRKGFALVEEHTGRQLTLANVPAEDPQVYRMICRADTIGVFQIESRAQMSMLPRLRPRRFYDLVIEVAIVRPGPIQGNMVHPYLRRRMGLEEVHYPNDAIRQVLEKTLGVPLFQEQAMRMAMVAAGFSPGEADQLRRAMGAWRRTGVIDQFRQRLLSGMAAAGLTAEFAECVFRQIRGFGEYGFPESHAASFALLVYVSAWLKCHHPAAFAAALLNSQPMGFYAPAQLVRDARDHGVEVRGVDVNFSRWDCTLEMTKVPRGLVDPSSNDPAGGVMALRLGLRMIAGLRQSAAERMESVRGKEPFRSLADFAARTRLGQAVIVRLSNADAFSSLGVGRRDALWNALAQRGAEESLPLLAGLETPDDRCAVLPPLASEEEVHADYLTTGLTLRAHPVSFYREQLSQMGVARSCDLMRLRTDRSVLVAGLVLLRQRPSTAKGITFVTLEDETGTVNLVVRQQTWDRYYQVARRSGAWVVRGRLERKQSVIHVLALRLEDLRGRLQELKSQSRDFR